MKTLSTIGAALALLLFFSVAPLHAQETCETISGVGTDIPDGGPGCGVPGAPIDITFDFSGLPSGFVSSVQVTDFTATHTWVGDLNAAVISPGGDVLSIINNPLGTTPTSCGDSSDLTGVSWSFSDMGTSDLEADATTAGGADETCQAGCDYMPHVNPAGVPHPGAPTVTAFADFLSAPDGNGTWTVRVWDAGGGDTGSVASVEMEVCTAPLPVELTEFRGLSNDEGISLHWVTATEENNAGFEVQTQRGSSWETLGWVEGNGSTTDEQNYSFDVDGLDYGAHNFRLRQVDYDGRFDFSDQIEVTYELANGIDLNPFYPNPFNPSGTFSILVANDQDLDIGVYDTIGRRVGTVYSGPVQAQQRHQFNFTADALLPSGSYFVRIDGELFSETMMISLIK